MCGRRWIRLVSLAVLTVVLTASPALAGPMAPQADLGTAFTYQGRLMESDVPADGPVDLVFELHSHATSETPVGSAQSVNDQELVDGYFTVQLDFGPVFGSTALWLDIQVRPGAETGAYTQLVPRQPLTANPQTQYALKAPWSGIQGLPGGFDDDVDNDTLGALAPCATGQVAAWTGSSWACADPGGGGSFWSLAGNSGTTPGTHFVGTTDNVGLYLAINGTPALRILPGPQSPSIVGGYAGNGITGGVSGAFIGAGGNGEHENEVFDDWGVVVGGHENTAGSKDGNVDSATYAVVVGGQGNEASAAYAFVGGGSLNEATEVYGTIPGGLGNVASGAYSFAAGYRARALHDGAFAWGDSTNVDFDSTGDDTFNVRSTGGAHIFVGDGGFTVADTPPDSTPPFSVGGDGVTAIDGASAGGPMLNVANASGRAVAGTSGSGSGIAFTYSPAILGDSQTSAGVAGLSHLGHGVIGETDAAAVDAAGVYGHNRQAAGYRNYGVMGKSDGSIGVGVHGTSSQAGGYGIRAENTSPVGVALDVTGSGIIQSTATTVIKVSPLDAVAEARSDLELHPNVAGYVEVAATTTGTEQVLIPVSVPAQLYGRAMSVDQVEIWYVCENSTSYVTISTLSAVEHGTGVAYFTENGDQTSTTWTSYTLSSSGTPEVNGSLYLRLDLQFASTSHYIRIGEISLTLVQD